jgi:CheY-like chemotaxis protein
LLWKFHPSDFLNGQTGYFFLIEKKSLSFCAQGFRPWLLKCFLCAEGFMKSEKARVLVVEDDNLFLWTLIHFLEKEGYEVVSAASGEKAYEMAQKGVFDIVISDFHLPGLNGKELIRRVKSIQPATKTVLITAYQPEEMGKEEGTLNAYLNKPIELRNLRKVLQELMR